MLIMYNVQVNEAKATHIWSNHNLSHSVLAMVIMKKENIITVCLQMLAGTLFLLTAPLDIQSYL